MNNSFKLKNFRVFDQEGADFEMAPLTILTGCNSSGKSSTIKSLMLLNKYSKALKSDYINGKSFFLKDNELLFNKGKHNLGTFEKALSKYSKCKTMSFSWKKYSPLFFGDLDVELSFVENKNNILNNAVVTNIKIQFENKDIIVLNFDEKFSFKIDYFILKERFFHFVHRLNYYNAIVNAIGVNDDNIPNQFQDEEALYNPEFGISKEYIDSVVYSQKELQKRDNGDELISKSRNLTTEHGSLFYLPILDWLKDVDKEEVNEVIWAKIEELKANEIDENTLNAVKNILNEFITSEFKTFKEYYLHQEDIFLDELSKQTRSYFIQGYSNSFIEEIKQNLDLVSIFLGPIFDFIRWDASKEVYADNPFTKFMFLAQFCCVIDKVFVKERVVFFHNEVNGPFEFLNPLEANAATQYLVSLVQDTVINAPTFIENIDFVDAVRANIQRMYTFNNQGTDFNELLLSYLGTVQKVLSKNNGHNQIKTYQLGSFMKKWLKIFEIADDVSFENTNEGLGVLIYLVKGKKKELLADQGYGITQLLAILLRIEINIITSEYTFNHPLIDSWNNKETKFRESTIAVEEPETNLHPKFQSKLADMFVDAKKSYNINFIVETHSEYLIRKLQYIVAKKEFNANDIAIHYLNDSNPEKRKKGEPQIRHIKIKEDGRLSQPFGSGFFDEADNLAMELLTLKSLN